MKQFSIYILIVLTFLAPSSSFGQTKAPTVTTSSTIATSGTMSDTLTGGSLSVKKVYVEGQLRTLLSQLNTIYTRTQLAVDRLNEKNIKTDAAQTALDKATLSLNDARLNIDAFAAISVPQESDKAKTTALSLTLKDAVKKSEDSLKTAREALIQSLTLLKTTLSVSLNTDAQ